MKRFHGQRIFIDTNIVIYAAEVRYKEADPSLKDTITIVRSLFQAFSEQKLTLVTSELTLSEVLTGALIQNKPRLADFYRKSLSETGIIETVSVQRMTWERVSELRAKFGSSLKTPDAVQIATAIESHSDALVCNDQKVAKFASETQEIIGVYLKDL